MSEKPQKRLVSWKHYMLITRDKFALYASAFVIALVGFIALVAAIINAACTRTGTGQFPINLVLLNILLGVAGLLGVRAGHIVFTLTRETGAFAPVTKQNAEYLPEVESLVRASDIPAANPQAELLRAAEQGPETPPEQLLRATRESRQDV